MLRCTTTCSNYKFFTLQFLPATFAVTLSAVALLIVLKVEFNFEVILHTVHYHFCFLNSRKLEQNSLESEPIIMFRTKILHQRGLNFSFCRLTTQPAHFFKNIAQQLSQCLQMTRHVYYCFPTKGDS